jgi:mannose-6-phosphate isomerase-like protein (cupin superfamily)
MIIKNNNANIKKVGPMIIKEYNINKNYSGALVEINGNHGKIKCLNEDRIYFIIDGDGKFIIENKEEIVSQNDTIFIPKNTSYNIIGKMSFFMICSPEFNPNDDIYLN